MDLSIATPAFHVPMALDADKMEQKRMWHHRFSRWLGRDESSPCQDQKIESDLAKPSLGRRLSRKVVPGLPRPATFRRQNSERRERLTPVNQSVAERRTLSVDRRRATSARPTSPHLIDLPKLSAPAVYEYNIDTETPSQPSQQQNGNEMQPSPTALDANHNMQLAPRPAPPPSPPPEDQLPRGDPPPEDDMDEEIRRELEERWILNLSMHFRDRSPREKFFVTYAETPTQWRRVTVSCDYRATPPDSLERDLQTLSYQRDKSARIYEAIRTSLPDIKFYSTVTNLRLETSDDDRLHVHVTEDVNEIIQYPSINTVRHLDVLRVSERDVHFESHMSGFVYKVRVNGKICIKKEIPGPDSVEEFLYEINALHSLVGSQNVIQFEGLVVDDDQGLVKGLLIGYAEQGPLVDLIYDFKDTPTLKWERRERWAQEIVRGLSEIHEAGFVQGDFTLSNIVIDERDTAKIIDINRRGCPVGWEPPEIEKMIESGQRISMYIGVKSDLFQLGMVLWALIEEDDEPERKSRPLKVTDSPTIPEHIRNIASICLSPRPRDRLAAKDLLLLFPERLETSILPPLLQSSLSTNQHHSLSIPSETRYIDPVDAVEREYIAQHSTPRHVDSHNFSNSSTYFDRHPSLDIPFDGPESYIVDRRGRTPPLNTTHLELPPFDGHYNDEPPTDQCDYEPQIVPISPSGENRWEEIDVDGHGYIFQRDLVDSDEDPEEMVQRRTRRTDRLDGDNYLRSVDHVDSGLADMDLVGIGENDMLKDYDKRDIRKDINDRFEHEEVNEVASSSKHF